MKKKILKYPIYTIIVMIVIIIAFSEEQFKEKYNSRNFREIKESGVITAVTEYNAISFYVDISETEGFDYELLNAFAGHHGLKVDITPEMSFKKRFEDISSGKYDIMATGTAAIKELKDSLLFTIPITIGRQVLIQRKDSTEGYYIKSQLDMAGKTIYTIKDSPAIYRMNNLMQEIADSINIKEVTQYGTEQLMAMVSGGDIDYAVCDENIAKLYLPNFDNLNISTKVSFNQFYSWGVNRNSPELLDSLNSWLEGYLKTDEYKALYKRYFK